MSNGRDVNGSGQALHGAVLFCLVRTLFNWRHWFTRKKLILVPSNIYEWICTRGEHDIPRVPSLALAGLVDQLYYRTTAALYESPISIKHRPSCPRIILKINFIVHVHTQCETMRSYHAQSTNTCKYLMSLKECTVKRGSLKMVSVHTETRWSYNLYVI